jgi:malate synthase
MPVAGCRMPDAGCRHHIFSAIKKFRNDTSFCLADRGMITTHVPFMRASTLLLLKTCPRGNAPAIGGMSALIPNKNDPQASERVLDGVRVDKRAAAEDGYDGGCVARPALVPVALAEFERVLGADRTRLRRSATMSWSAPPTCCASSPQHRSPWPACA